ncbi:MAG: reverse transcriptase domain-containing protein [Chloroflexota bacterium]|nr:reverse transcriptase domain-containing protein [Chloroflexota bacterium]
MSLSLTTSDDALVEGFFSLQTREDIAELLDVSNSKLVYHLYTVPHPERYAVFEIPKRSGGHREISAPATALKIIQRKLNQVLQQVYEPKASVHGFVAERSIVTNAEMHSRQRYVLNVDLKDFFPSINFGRVRGMFMAVPYNRPAEVATVLAQICCFDNQLPQGAPTSPVVSNMICAKMDSQLLRLAQRNRCVYTRYVDDMTFSTSLPSFPKKLARLGSSGQVEIGSELEGIIAENGFEINDRKVRLQTKYGRQEVTGLTVNEFPNVDRKFIRQIRAMLHAWKEFGLAAAEDEFFRRYDKKHRNPDKERPSFAHIVKGKIEFLGMVRGKDDSYYKNFCGKLWQLAPELVGESPIFLAGQDDLSRPLIVTEGKTDWKHLKAALAALKADGYFRELDIEFLDDEEARGSADLEQFCEQHAKAPQNRKFICVFDRDERGRLERVHADPFKDWNNNTFSFAIPVPDHRKDTPVISIEFYYRDQEICREDANGRRLFLSSEFDTESGRHKTEDLNCTLLNKIKRPDQVKIVDKRVFNCESENVALPKDDFATYVLNQEDGYADFDFSAFKAIFDIVSMIVEED